MKILHTADWHLGKRLERFSRLEEQQAALDELIAIANEHSVDLVLVAGDLFDTYNPPNEASELFYKALRQLTANGSRPVVAIAGNHDSPERIEAPDPLARSCGIVFSGFPYTQLPTFNLDNGVSVTQADQGFINLTLPNVPYPVRVLMTPYANEYRLKQFLGVDNHEEEMRAILARHWQHLSDQYCDVQGVNVLVAHLFVVERGRQVLDEPEGEKPILHVGGAQAIYTDSIPEQIQYVALGHLHRQHAVPGADCPVYYSGSPLSYSFAEAGQKKYALLVEVAPGEPAEVTPLPLQAGKALVKKRFETTASAVAWLEANQNQLVELTMATETYLTAEEKKALYDCHDGIVSLVPEVKNSAYTEGTAGTSIDLTKPINDLFAEYFEFKTGQPPNESLQALFKEVIGTDSTTT